MHLYNLTLVPPSNITAAVVGQFSGTRQQEIVVCRGGSRLELIRPDVSQGKLRTIITQNAFATVRSLASFRLTGGSKDYLILGSDSGRIAIAEYDDRRNALTVLHQETFGRSGSRRIVPGQYLATDPKGRAVMIGAVEKAKLVYILNRDVQANLTISSPLEAHRSNAIIHALIGVDVGYENPIFAALEVDYEESDRDWTGEAKEQSEKMLTYYELDLGLNHVVRRWSSAVDIHSSHLVQVPGGYNQNTERWEGPSGVLVCSEDYITYKHNVGHEHRVPIPRRLNPVERDDERRGCLIVASVCHRMKTAFFFLLQNEDGDLFKITIDHEGEDMTSLNIKYFDTLPFVAVNLCILRAGYLYAAAEYGPSALYSFQKLGDDDDLPIFSSVDYPQLGMQDRPPCPTFTPRPLDNLVLTDESQALDPIVDARAINALNADTPQIIAACGKGARSSVKMIQHGLEVQEAVSSELPGVPKSVWTTRLRADDQFDSFIILSFVNGTLVLSIGETIEEVSDSGLLTSAPTLAIQQLGPDALLQVHPDGIRHIMSDKQVTEWTAPETAEGESNRIVQAATNGRQVVVALEPSNELVYFELDMDGQLNEYQERKAMGTAVLTLSLGDVPEGRQRTPFLAVGCQDQTVRIVSLDPDSTLASLSIQALTAPAHSICIAEMHDMAIDRNHPTLFVNIGLTNGVLLRTVLDPISGQLTDTRIRFLGARPVRLVRVRIQGGASAVLALSSRSWLLYTDQERTHFDPLLFDALDHAWTFSAELCPEGLIGISAGNLRIFTVPNLGQNFKMSTTPLSQTPRKFVHHPTDEGLLYVAASDHRVLSPFERAKRLSTLGRDVKPKESGVLSLAEQEFGAVKAGPAYWSSSISILDLRLEGSPFSTIDLEDNEAALCIAVVRFAKDSTQPKAVINGNGLAHSLDEGHPFSLVVGSTKSSTVIPRASQANYLTVYTLSEDGRHMHLLHKTEVDEIISAIQPFQGKLLVGAGKALRLYDMGRKKLLRKCEVKIPSVVTSIRTQGTRIVVADAQESTFFVTYKARENRMLVFADDTLPRWSLSACMLDYDTVCAGDKFGNVFVNRLDAEVSRIVDEDVSGTTIMQEKGYLQGAPHKLALEAHFHVGDVITSLNKVSLVPGGRPIIMYTGLSGTVGCLIALTSKEDVNMLNTLEMHLRQEQQTPSSIVNMVGRDHLAFRGSYHPVKDVIDGDLCELFALLPLQRQLHIAEELDRTPAEINKKLESLRATNAF